MYPTTFAHTTLIQFKHYILDRTGYSALRALTITVDGVLTLNNGVTEPVCACATIRCFGLFYIYKFVLFGQRLFGFCFCF